MILNNKTQKQKHWKCLIGHDLERHHLNELANGLSLTSLPVKREKVKNVPILTWCT